MKLDRSPTATVDDMWDELVDAYGVSDETLQVVTAINGYSRQTMEDVLYAVAGLRSFDQDDDDTDDDAECFDGTGACGLSDCSVCGDDDDSL
jgi:hypothetical protein